MTAQPFRAQDKACLSALSPHIALQFDGLYAAIMSAPSFTTDSGKNFTLLTYVGVKFRSSDGDQKGVLACVFLKAAKSVSTATVNFEGNGFVGTDSFGR